MTSTTQRPRNYAGRSEDERRADRRERLIEAGFVQFGRHGFAATTVDAVCAEARVGKRYFYEAFAGLEPLLVAVYESAGTRLLEGVAAAVAAHPDDLRLGMRAGLAEFFRAMENDAGLARIMFVEVVGVSDEMDEVIKGTIDGAIAMLESLMEGMDFRGVPARTLAQMAVGMVAGTSLWRVYSENPGSVDELLHGIETLFDDVLADATRRAP